MAFIIRCICRKLYVSHEAQFNTFGFSYWFRL